MYALRLGLSLAYIFFSAKILLTIFSGDRPIYALVIIFVNCIILAALYHKGGKATRYIAYAACCIISFGLLIIVWGVINLQSSNWDSNSEIMNLVYNLCLYSIGIPTAFLLKYYKYKIT
jgi:predicted permease